jgi:hypothetical protein
MGKNQNLHAAKEAKNDEFYTQLADIEKELANYTDHFAGKVVYLPADAEWSNFWVYFVREFHVLGLKRLVATSLNTRGISYKLESDGVDIIRTPLVFDGDFRSPECLAVLYEADIVVTNPPFSLFRELVGLLVRFNKQFLLVGSANAITYKEIFSLIKDSALWLGCTNIKRFISPDGDVSQFVCWFTNLPHKKRAKWLELTCVYDPAKYPKYDNYDAIECSKVADIPKDYYKVIGVPITFLDKFNPEQFEIVGQTMSSDVSGFETSDINTHNPFIDGCEIYRRILIKQKMDRG